MGGDDVDDSVEKALQGKDERLYVVEPEDQSVGVGDGVEAVDGRGDPTDEEGAEKKERDPRIKPGVGVRFSKSMVSGQAAHFEHLRR